MERSIVLVPCVAEVFVILLALNSGVVFAEELKVEIQGSFNALDSGYAITRWPWDGGELFPGESAAVRAGATEPRTLPLALHVVFRRNRPDGSHWDTPPKSLTKSEDTWNGKAIWDVYDTQTLDMDGDWGVQALFDDDQGKLQGPDPYPIVKIKAISWHVVPEIPLGTVATILSMLGALSVFAIAIIDIADSPIFWGSKRIPLSQSYISLTCLGFFIAIIGELLLLTSLSSTITQSDARYTGPGTIIHGIRFKKLKTNKSMECD